MENRRASDKVIELLFEEFKHFRNECKDDSQATRKSIEDQSKLLLNHTEQLIKLSHVLNGNGTKGLISRIEELESYNEIVKRKFTKIETTAKVRAAVLGFICAVCSVLGGVITYCISLYIALHK